MDSRTVIPAVPPDNPASEPPARPPAGRAACLARLADLHDEIAAIRAQIAAADLDRQARRGSGDARWFHRAKTALRHRQREAADITALLATLPSCKDGLKDQIIAVVRPAYDDDAWHAVLDEAHRRLREGM